MKKAKEKHFIKIAMKNRLFWNCRANFIKIGIIERHFIEFLSKLEAVVDNL